MGEMAATLAHELNQPLSAAATYLHASQIDMERAGPLGDSAMRVCAAPAYLDRRGQPRRVAELTQHNCLSYTLSAKQGREHWSFGAAGEHRVPVSGNLTANNGDALLAAALRGQGIIYQPDFIVGGAVARGDLVVLELDRPPVALGGIHVLYPPDRRPPAKVRVMVDYLAGVFAGGAAAMEAKF